MIDKSFNMFIETEVPSAELIISRTDLEGNITYVNETFADISGYGIEELIGEPHSVVRHPDMPKSLFKDLWKSIKSGDSWVGYVKNLRKDGGYYWVKAEVSGVYKDNELIEYKSIREPIPKELRLQMQESYDKLREEEDNSIRITTYVTKLQLESIKDLLQK